MLSKNICNTLDIYKKIKKFIDGSIGSILFFLENYRKRYPYILVGEKHNHSSRETLLLYRTAGKRQVFEKTAKELCNEKELINKFHPLDVRSISFIAGVESILEISPEKRVQKFKVLKEKIVNKLF